MNKFRMLEIILSIVKNAGEIILNMQNKANIVDMKGVFDYATSADWKCEEFIVEEILKNYPDHNILTEEKRSLDQKSKFTWVIDPIDGTKNYYRGLPFYAISVALRKDDDYVLGVVYNPQTRQLFWAKKGSGALLNGNKIKLSNEKLINQAIIIMEHPHVSGEGDKRNEYFELMDKLHKNVFRVRNFGAASLALCYTAMGGYDMYVDLSGNTKEWDIAAGTVILNEAGGIVRKFDKGVIMAGNKDLVSQAIEML